MNRLNLLIFSWLLPICCFMPAAILIEAQQERREITLETYVNEEKCYSIDYPSDWRAVADFPTQDLLPKIDLVLLAPAKYGFFTSANMNIYSDYVGESMTLDNAYSEAMSEACLPIIDSGDIMINGIPSKWIFSNFQFQEIEVQILQFLIIAQEMRYLITFGATSDEFIDYFSEFESIVSSFRLFRDIN